jgi:hypothetical protein
MGISRAWGSAAWGSAQQRYPGALAHGGCPQIIVPCKFGAAHAPLSARSHAGDHGGRGAPSQARSRQPPPSPRVAMLSKTRLM